MHRRILLRIGLRAESVRSPAFAASRCLALTKDSAIADWRGSRRILYRRSGRNLYNLKKPARFIQQKLYVRDCATLCRASNIRKHTGCRAVLAVAVVYWIFRVVGLSLYLPLHPPCVGYATRGNRLEYVCLFEF